MNKGGRDMNVADRIQNLRKIKGISQEQLAEAIGVYYLCHYIWLTNVGGRQ